MIKVSIENPHVEDINALKDIISFLSNIVHGRVIGAEDEQKIKDAILDTNIKLPTFEEKKESDGNSDFDSAGVQFDPKIHARTRAKNVDGTWRRKRGLELTEEQVPSQSMPEPRNVNSSIPVASGKCVDQTGNGNHAVIAESVVTVDPVVSVEPAKRFENLVSRITNLRLDGKLTQVQVTQINKKYGLTGFHEIMPSRPDIIDKYAADVEAVANLG